MHIRRVARVVVAASTLLLVSAASARAQFLASQPATGEQYNVEVGLMFWSPDPGIVLSSGGLSAFSPGGVDFVQEFGIETKRFTEFRAVVRGGRHKFRYSRVPIRYEAETVLQRTITFGGQTFDVTADATANLEWNIWRAGYEYDFVKMDRGLLGLIVQVQKNTVRADVRATSAFGSGATLSETDVPIPTLGFIGRVYPHRNVAITAEYSGFKAPGFIRDRFADEGEELDATLKDFDISATVSFTRFLGVQGGYRSLTADYIVDDDTGDLKMKGLYFGGVVRF